VINPDWVYINAPGQVDGKELVTTRSTINLTMMQPQEMKRHYIKFMVEGLYIDLVDRGSQEEFTFSAASSQGKTRYTVHIWRQFDLCSGELATCRKHGDVIGSCSCQGNEEKRLTCKHLIAGYVKALFILMDEGVKIKPASWVEEAAAEAGNLIALKHQKAQAKKGGDATKKKGIDPLPDWDPWGDNAAS
jgi:hypothetical protein